MTAARRNASIGCAVSNGAGRKRHDSNSGIHYNGERYASDNESISERKRKHTYKKRRSGKERKYEENEVNKIKYNNESNMMNIYRRGITNSEKEIKMEQVARVKRELCESYSEEEPKVTLKELKEELKRSIIKLREKRKKRERIQRIGRKIDLVKRYIGESDEKDEGENNGETEISEEATDEV